LKGAQPGDVLILIGESTGHLGASLYAREWLGLKGEELGPPPPVDLATEVHHSELVRGLIERGLVTAVHDVSEGGVACAAAEMALSNGTGVQLDDTVSSTPSAMFGERGASFLIAVSPEIIRQYHVETEQSVRVGEFGGDSILGVPLGTLRAAHEGWLPRYMKG
jgi:phosphoribosylformylglycinamidine synthase